MILKQNLDVVVPKYNGTIVIIFFFSIFLEQIQKADQGAIVFRSWVDVISNCTRSCNTSSATLKGLRNSKIQPIQEFFTPNCFK